MEKINVLIDKQTIEKRIAELGEEITKYTNGEETVLICVLNGAAYFAIDLSKRINNPNLIIDFIKISSYGINARESTKNINFKLDITQDITNKNVIIVEDIIDSGNSLKFLYNHLKAKNPKSLKICVLLDKKSRREVEVDVDYTGFEIENKFVVGYGLDYDEKLRHLDFVGYIGE